MGLKAWKTWRAGFQPGSEAAADYAGAVSLCAGDNQINRLHIDIERHHAPTEIAAIARLAQSGSLPDATRAWLAHLRGLSPTLLRHPQPYVRQPVDDQIMLYRASGRMPQDRSLLIAFCGNSFRLMMPAALFLQALPAGTWDVLKVSRRPDCSYLAEGREAADMDDLVRRLRAAVDLDRYTSLTLAGVSSGGRIAAVAALRLAADRAVLFGSSKAAELAPLLPDLARDPRDATGPANRPRPRFLHCHGAGHAPDATVAATMRQLFGGDLHGFDGIDRHAMLYALLQSGWLDRSLSDFLRPAPAPSAADRASRAHWRRAGP